MKKNHHSLSYKREKEPNKKYKDLKQKQKAKISDWMFETTCDFYREQGRLPEKAEREELVTGIFHKKIEPLAIWVPLEEVQYQYRLKFPRYESRIAQYIAGDGLPEKKVKKEKSVTDAPKKKRGSSNKICPACGRRMRQQFIGLQHCRCGMSWKKNMGFFERTSDMVFALERRKIGKKTKQCPVIRYK